MPWSSLEGKALPSITEEPHKILHSEALLLDDELSDEGMQEQQACMITSPALMLGSCLVSFFTLFLCKMRLNQPTTQN